MLQPHLLIPISPRSLAPGDGVVSSIYWASLYTVALVGASHQDHASCWYCSLFSGLHSNQSNKTIFKFCGGIQWVDRQEWQRDSYWIGFAQDQESLTLGWPNVMKFTNDCSGLRIYAFNFHFYVDTNCRCSCVNTPWGCFLWTFDPSAKPKPPQLTEWIKSRTVALIILSIWRTFKCIFTGF